MRFLSLLAVALALAAGTYGAVVWYVGHHPKQLEVRLFGEDFKEKTIHLRLNELDGPPEPSFEIPGFHPYIYSGTRLRVTGQHFLFGSEFIPVDTSKTYKMAVGIRALPTATDAVAVEYAGFATFDSEKKLQTTSPGKHRYAVLRGKPLSPEQGWMRFEGTITGTGNENEHQFRPGTAYIKPVLFLNKGSRTAVTEIDYIVVSVIEEPQRR